MRPFSSIPLNPVVIMTFTREKEGELRRKNRRSLGLC